MILHSAIIAMLQIVCTLLKEYSNVMLSETSELNICKFNFVTSSVHIQREKKRKREERKREKTRGRV